MAEAFNFDPDKVAYYEKAGWEAYYDRNWPRAFRLLVQLNREQFRMSWPTAILAALDTVRASMAFAPLDKSDVPTATRHVRKFYEKARRSLGITSDATTLAELEMDYWVVHRQLAIRRQQNPADQDIEPLIQSLARLHAALFNATVEQMRPSAEYRALANKTVDEITGKRSTNVAEDWRTVERYLQQAYRAVKRDV
ncbi:MAG TPA: hypothetical protein VER55_06430 [Ardenticatenaceae bacterium]|nr:hypothetical protein [Ardenticatenaceae bacterium]